MPGLQSDRIRKLFMMITLILFTQVSPVPVRAQSCSGTLMTFTRATGSGYLQLNGSSPAGMCWSTALTAAPAGVKIGPTGSIFVWLQNSGPLLEHDRNSGALLRTVAASGAGGGLQGRDIEFMPNGDVLVAGGSASRVARFNGTTGAYLGDFVTAGSGGLMTCYAMGWAPWGNLMVSSSGAGQILEYDGTTGAFVRVFASSSAMMSPYDLTFGPNGDLYVTNVNAGEVHRFDGVSGVHRGVFNLTLVPNARGLEFGPNGNLYVCSWSGSLGGGVYEFNGTTGAMVGLAAAGSAAMFLDFDCFMPTQCAVQPQPQTVCLGGTLQMSVVAHAKSPRYQWRRNGIALPGKNMARLTMSNVAASDAGLYDCVISNACGSITSFAAAVNVAVNNTRIITQPLSMTPDIGQTTTFECVATGATNFQWRKNGQNLANDSRISGATSPMLSIANVNWSDVGSYSCIVGDNCGSVASVNATLQIFSCNEIATSLDAQPFGNRANMGVAYSGVNGGILAFGGTIDGNLASSDTWLLKNSVWTRVATTGPGTRSITTMCELANGRVLLFGGHGVFNDVASGYGDTWEWNGTSWVRLATTGPEPRAGNIMVYDSNRNKVVLFGGLGISGASLNDTWEWNGTSWTQVAFTGPGARFGHAAAFDPVSGETIVFGGWDGWFDGETWAWNGTSWRLAATTGVGARQYPGMTFDENVGKVMLFGGFEGGANVKGDSYYWTASGWQPTGLSAISQPRWVHGMAFDRESRSVVLNAGKGLNQVVLSDTVIFSSRPIPTSQPQDQTLVPGGGATFSVTSSRADTVYQWKKDGVNVVNDARISGATSATLVISNLQAADGGNYSCALTNACGSNSSSSASLSCRPTVAQQPVGGSVKSGRSLQLVAQMVTTGSTTYRWKKDGVNLFNSDIYSGATSQSLTINAEDPTQSGLYTLAATNSCGTRTTDGVTISVSCLGDVNLDGNVDSDDVIEFFASWDAGLAAGDVNQDGGTDSDDVIAYFHRWDRGC